MDSPEMVRARERLAADTGKIDALISRLYTHGLTLAREGVKAYSKAHPRRKVMFCSAMGSNTLHVESGGTCRYRGDYQLHEGQGANYPPPAWMIELENLCSEYRLGTFPGPVRITCKGGEIVEEIFDW